MNHTHNVDLLSTRERLRKIHVWLNTYQCRTGFSNRTLLLMHIQNFDRTLLLPVLWERRKNFVMFLSEFFDLKLSNESNATSVGNKKLINILNDYNRKKCQLLESVFVLTPIHRLITSFL